MNDFVVLTPKVPLDPFTHGGIRGGSESVSNEF